ncbi:T9SS type A sorting domain-containing protein [Owenweeksia hongkongensis]|uniref:T9SS type A sorting domain-containing protein n=1 Tax=Owenweeksia hongkongensis TaxID=253245 RepID=UPI003A92D2DD
MKKQVLRTLFFSIAFLTGFLTKAQNDCPTWEWAFDMGLPAHAVIMAAQGDTSGNMYIVAGFYGTVTLGPTTLTTSDTSYFVGKLSTNNTWLWAVQFEAEMSQYALATNVASEVDLHYDEAGFLMVGGNFNSSASFGNLSLSSNYASYGYYNNFVAKLNTNTQQWLWASKAEAPLNMRMWDIAGDDVGNTYFTGEVGNNPFAVDTMFFGNIKTPVVVDVAYIAKINSQGDWVWVKTIQDLQSAILVAVDNNQNPTVVSTCSDSVVFANQVYYGDDLIAVLGFTSSGVESWCHTAEGDADVNYLKYDSSNNLYLTGRANDTVKFGSNVLYVANSIIGYGLVAQLNVSRQWTWAESYSSIGNSVLAGYGITGITTGAGDTYLSGLFNGKVYFGNDTLQGVSLRNLFVTKINSVGQWEWAGMAYSPDNPSGTWSNVLAMSADINEHIYLAGRNSETFHFGMHTSASNGNFLAKFKPNSSLSFQLPADTILSCGDSIKLIPRSSIVPQLYYSWSPSHGLSDSTAQFPYASPDTTITYTVNVYSNTGCVASDQITIGRDSAAWYGTGIPLITSTANKVFCDNSNFSISAPTNYQNYKWSTGSTTFTTTINKPGTYVLTAKDENGCYKRDSIVIVGPVSITPKVPLICANDSVFIQINAQGLDSLRWNNGSSNAMIYASQAGKYWVTVHKGNCSYTDTVNVQLFTDTANATFSTHIVNLAVDFTPNSIGVVSGLWNFGDGVSTTGTTASHIYAANGLYNVCFTATDICGIQAEYCDTVKVPNIGIEELPVRNVFSLYPNPAASIVNIESSSEQTPLVQLVDLSGKVVLIKEFNRGKLWQIDIHHLPAGYYFINIDGTVSKLVKI